MKKYILILFAFNIFYSCTKDHFNPAIDCKDLPHEPMIGWNYQVDSPEYQFPYFNPNNPTEIIFQSVSAGHGNLYKYNLITKQKTLIYPGANLFQPKWGKNDWILLNPNDANIWKIKSNGDSLTQLTFTNGDFGPEWNLNSDKFSCFRSIGSFQKTVIFDAVGNILDTLYNCGIADAGSSWQHPTLAVNAGPLGLNIADPVNDTMIWLIHQQEPMLQSAMWLSNFIDIIYSADNGIFKINSLTKAITSIKPSCTSKFYLFPTYSSQMDKIIYERIDKVVINSTTLEVKFRLYMMNADGTDEEEIIIN